MGRALVLGGGGPVGVAWETGVVAGLAEAGIDLAAADRIVGTSAGSVVGARLALGLAPRELYATRLASDAAQEHRRGPAGLPPPDLAPLMHFLARRPAEGPAPASLLAEIGAFARRAATIGEDDFLADMAQLVGTDQAWPERFVCTAIDAETGLLQVWDKAAGVDLSRAVASSCAVPGLYPTVTIAGRHYMDGGLRSATNIDLAEGFAIVVALAVTLQSFAAMMAASAGRELACLEKGGSRTALIVPDAAALAAFGPNLMDSARRAEVASAGLNQGRAEADRLRGVWT